MQKSAPIGISIPIEILQRIDLERGDVSRSKYIVKKLGLSNSKSQKNFNQLPKRIPGSPDLKVNSILKESN